MYTAAATTTRLCYSPPSLPRYSIGLPHHSYTHGPLGQLSYWHAYSRPVSSLFNTDISRRLSCHTDRQTDRQTHPTNVQSRVSGYHHCIAPITTKEHIGKGKGSSPDIASLTTLNSGALQPRKWQLIGNDCSTAAQASGCP